MLRQKPVAAVTGASGYLGSQICETLESGGWHVVRLVRSPERSHGQVLPYDLATPVTARVREALRSANALIHAAYDLSLTSPADIWRVNVEGTRRLLEAAKEAAVGRIIVFSSMSAFAGTSQLYGRAKLDIEAMTINVGAVRFGQAWYTASEAGGMAGALRKAHHLADRTGYSWGVSSVYTVREEDLMAAIALLTSAADANPRNDLYRSSEPGVPDESVPTLCSTGKPSVPVRPRALAAGILAAEER